MEQLREELERRNEEDKAKLTQELKDLKQRMVSTNGFNNVDASRTDDGDLRHNSAYELMQSIAYTTIGHKPSPDISDRVVVGQESRLLCSPHLFKSSAGKQSFPSYSSSSPPLSISSSPSTSPENRFRSKFITEDPLGADMVNIGFREVRDTARSDDRGFTVLSKVVPTTEEEDGLITDNTDLSPMSVASTTSLTSKQVYCWICVFQLKLIRITISNCHIYCQK